VLFVCSGNRTGSPGVIVQAQGNSLTKAGLSVKYYVIKGTGLKGYLINIIKLKRYLKKNRFDVIHAHYAFTGIVAAAAKSKEKLVVSLMGSDVLAGKVQLHLASFFSRYAWNTTIVKTEGLSRTIKNNTVKIIPNGVDLNTFKPEDQTGCKLKLGFDVDKKQVLFLADISRYSKDFPLAQSAFNLLEQQLKDCEFKVVSGIKHDLVPIYLNAADVLLCTSRYEGSPNTIKEAMACNCPVVSTDVGDVRWLFDGCVGYCVTGRKTDEIALKLSEAILNRKNANGRNRLVEIGLDSENISKKIITVYTSLLQNSKG
jgi:glycosyltransferase involved in cell wall biosynthesis